MRAFPVERTLSGKMHRVSKLLVLLAQQYSVCAECACLHGEHRRVRFSCVAGYRSASAVDIDPASAMGNCWSEHSRLWGEWPLGKMVCLLDFSCSSIGRMDRFSLWPYPLSRWYSRHHWWRPLRFSLIGSANGFRFWLHLHEHDRG